VISCEQCGKKYGANKHLWRHKQILKYIAPHFQLRGEVELLDDVPKVVVHEKNQQKRNHLKLKINNV
jgi:hypothetical protein